MRKPRRFQARLRLNEQNFTFPGFVHAPAHISFMTLLPLPRLAQSQAAANRGPSPELTCKITSGRTDPRGCEEHRFFLSSFHPRSNRCIALIPRQIKNPAECSGNFHEIATLFAGIRNPSAAIPDSRCPHQRGETASRAFMPGMLPQFRVAGSTPAFSGFCL
jgi:hypothetical protein